MNGNDAPHFKSVAHAIYWEKSGHILSDAPTTIYNPRSAMTRAEKDMEETTEYEFGDDEQEEEQIIKSKLF